MFPPYQTQLTYLHLPLLTDAQGRKLSKSEASLPVDATHARDLLRWMWQLLGQEDGALDASDNAADMLVLARSQFQPARLPRALPAAPTMPLLPATRLHGT